MANESNQSPLSIHLLGDEAKKTKTHLEKRRIDETKEKVFFLHFFPLFFSRQGNLESSYPLWMVLEPWIMGIVSFLSF